MSPWLKPRLLALLGVAVLIGGANYLHAQNDYGPPAKTPEEAARNFYGLLGVLRNPDYLVQSGAMTNAKFRPLLSSIERDQFDALGRYAQNGGTDKFIRALAAQAPQMAAYTPQVKSSANGQTVVTMKPSSVASPREVVVVPEDGGFRVDAVATYARWNGIAPADADKVIFGQTGFLTPKLAKDPAFLGAATLGPCQSNLRQIGLALTQYTQDYDERLPRARNWTENLYPYVKSRRVFECPALSGKGSGYAMNSRISQVSLAGVNQTAQTVSFYESSNPAPNLFAPFTGRAYRHAKNGAAGMNIAFVDGHVAWFAQGSKALLSVDPAAFKAPLVPISTTP